MKTDTSKMVCTICGGDSFHVLMVLGTNTHTQFECANPICKEPVESLPKYFRFKSNTKTIVERLGKKQVQIVWGETFEYGMTERFIYSYDPANLIPLTEEETREVLSKIKSKV